MILLGGQSFEKSGKWSFFHRDSMHGREKCMCFAYFLINDKMREREKHLVNRRFVFYNDRNWHLPAKRNRRCVCIITEEEMVNMSMENNFFQEKVCH